MPTSQELHRKLLVAEGKTPLGHQIRTSTAWAGAEWGKALTQARTHKRYFDVRTWEAAPESSFMRPIGSLSDLISAPALRERYGKAALSTPVYLSARPLTTGSMPAFGFYRRPTSYDTRQWIGLSLPAILQGIYGERLSPDSLLRHEGEHARRQWLSPESMLSAGGEEEAVEAAADTLSWLNRSFGLLPAHRPRR